MLQLSDPNVLGTWRHRQVTIRKFYPKHDSTNRALFCTMKLLVIILNYRVTDLTIDCLKSIEPEIASVPGMRVAVCENGTGGDAEQRLRDAIVENGWSSWAELTTISPESGFHGWQQHHHPEGIGCIGCSRVLPAAQRGHHGSAGGLEALVRSWTRIPKAGVAGSRLDIPDGSPKDRHSDFRGSRANSSGV